MARKNLRRLTDINEADLHQLTELASLKQFVLGGNAIFTVRSKATGTRFTYLVSEPEEKDASRPVHFVSVLTGSDNTKSYSYAGIIEGETRFRTTAKSKLRIDAPSVQGFLWLLTNLLKGVNVLDQCDFFHASHCCRCGKLLTTPQSVAAGIGPDCATRAEG